MAMYDVHVCGKSNLAAWDIAPSGSEADEYASHPPMTFASSAVCEWGS
jgi:hypothetical protein